MRRGTFLLVVGIGVPVLLLALGWWTTSAREAAAQQREARALLERSAQVVRGVVDASLAELRAREDARPFDAYNYVYNPPGVVSLTDALALSPLARDPDDRRVIGYFQIDRVGPRIVIKTPYERDPLARASTRARMVASRIEDRAFSELAGLATGPDLREEKIEVAAAIQRGTNPAANNDNNKQASIAALNTLQNQVYAELQEAETSSSKRSQLSQAKVIPQLNRKNVDWNEELPSKKGKPKKEGAYKSSTPFSTAPNSAPTAQADDFEKQQKLVVTRAAPKPQPAPRPKPPEPQPAQPTIEYAPMVFDTFGDDLVLYRLVSSGESRSVQGALLDKKQIYEAFIPSVIERHVIAAVRPRVVDAAFAGPCSLRAAASDVLEEAELCFPSAALAELDDGSRAFEGGLLGLLLVVIGAAVVATDRAARRADELARQKGAFISAISHELRTPLTTLRMHAELLRDNLVGPDRRGKFHDDMVRESVRLSHLVENVLEATRLEEGRRPLRSAVGSLGDAVKECCDGQAAFVAAKGFSLDVQVEPVEASFDRQAIEQIVVNLLDNAAKYAADATDKTLHVTVTDEGARACIRVIDHGPGIPPEHHDKVFHRFFRVDRPGQDHVVGTGLGLALVRELAQAHGGTAVVEEPRSGGCCIAVRIPRGPRTA